ncbi:TauD/TfdA family dioxygenase [Nocardia farcinica]|uniref:TauD/TfdA dioxygenase family protein n=1 Tax=Nocardia farcinica TaxID=37329 RepID=UPI0018945AEF|nr:TauD/TfdA family dioxygenase [Nocardia farcinica]MBF6253602.1 TauD/TfdA family dioxygenase [Nocardia farcinica]MBF6294224.1 TauD/TfdA family dioxygenase [Nocardia farcinica]MBF6381066.1 TauD/TfdA family dioxygenase [Nocardia farcinica]MBF6421200.1 TauD/TfdA family dioxygenase [Nocardia farcinica]MBF6432857.1 TauD/TfdA family dioxygenase [Nocardia farcinica]
MTAVTENPVTTDTVHVAPVAGHIGADITGVDLREPLTDPQVEAITSALHTYKVLFFRDQHIGHAEHVAFSRRFGAVTPSHPYDDDAPTDYPEILAVDTRLYEKRFGVRKASYTNQWHTDVSPLINPPAASILRAEIAPERGGDTRWTNLVAAYEHLPESLRRFVDGLRAEHRFGGSRPAWSTDSDYAKKVAAAPLVTEHPVVRVHPVTGERALFVNPGFTTRIVGLTPAQSDAVLRLLFDHLTDPAFTVSFRWRPGSIAFWDNRTTAHLAPSDIDHLDVTRVLYRTTLEGDIPVGVDGRPSTSVAGERFTGA